MIIITYIIIHTTNEIVRRQLTKLKDFHSKLFVMEMNANTRVMRNNGLSLSYIANLMSKYPNEVYVWAAERVTLRQFPKECIKAGNWLGPGRKLRDVPKYLNIPREVLEKCKINYSLNLRE